MKAKVNKNICIGCGACTAIACNFFEIGDDGLAQTITPEDIENNEINMERVITDEDKDDVLDAADGCPVGAIEIIKEDK